MSNLLEIKNVKKYFLRGGGFLVKPLPPIRAVDGVSLKIGEKETVGLVGESGCGKTTIGRVILKLYQPTEGKIFFEGKDLTNLSKKEMEPLRREMQIIFQDPFSSLHPRMRIRQILKEPFLIHRIGSKKDQKEKILELLQEVGLEPESLLRFPHEFSGGQRQRIGIARAIALNPKLIIADEPVSALDVSIQAQIIDLLDDLQKKFSLSYLFIAHDLSVVEHISDRVMVMYVGKIVEQAVTRELYGNPLHPYTKALLSAVPVPDPHLKKEREILKGDLPNPANPPSGCRFHTRCQYAKPKCREEEPKLKDVGAGHKVACHLI